MCLDQFLSHRNVSENSNSNQNTDGLIDTSVSQIINQFAQADLHSDDDAFRLWLSRKKEERKLRTGSSSGTTRSASPTQNNVSFQIPINDGERKAETGTARASSPALSLVPSQLSAATINTHPTQLDLEELLTKRARSQQAFLAWVARKEVSVCHLLTAHTHPNTRFEGTTTAQEESLRRKMEKEKEVQLVQQHQEQQRKEREKEAIRRWKLEKVRKDKEAEERREREAAEEEERKRQREKLGNEAFEAWRKEKEKNGGSLKGNLNLYNTGPFAAHSHRWLDIVPPSGSHKHQRLSKAQQSQLHELLSPPNLYKDYVLYETMAPNYKIKYPSQVASGGVGLCLSSFETNLIPPPPQPQAPKPSPVIKKPPKKPVARACRPKVITK
ncbi:hypothetical protein BCR33DRAFT_787691 [Rhizoclosmatium globosum]|uniref:Uncharacterized protein n=1 Tax=Rhizoclosmatium globosum TaxID=329046 RepID=A0A1Y2BZP2_9FUNG|nr:hypothetical protein BCR33DRAFT_787691 [Rhizoclosmatium globosum]|eukprot:ORY40134.1 hypothetical protein BCR33DRAFT_787691 [Rhizoclosmatium globosum]